VPLRTVFPCWLPDNERNLPHPNRDLFQRETRERERERDRDSVFLARKLTAEGKKSIPDSEMSVGKSIPDIRVSSPPPSPLSTSELSPAAATPHTRDVAKGEVTRVTRDARVHIHHMSEGLNVQLIFPLHTKIS